METNKAMVIPVTLKGSNYLLWSRMIKTALGGRGLWSHVTDEGPRPSTKEGEEEDEDPPDLGKWMQEDMMVLSIIQGSLEPSILEAYSYCEKAKDLWETLQKVYGNISNLSRVFEVKRAINNLSQEEIEFTAHLGKFRALWSELEMLRPNSMEQDVLNERREQDKVFGLLLTLNPTYNDLIKHILRAEKLPDLEDVCAQIQKEQGSLGLFGGKGDLVLANKAEEMARANKAAYRGGDDRRTPFNGVCDHCKRQGHKKSQCWILHPHLKPKFMRDRDARAHYTAGSTEPGSSSTNGNQTEGGKALATSVMKHTDDEVLRKSDLDLILKALKEHSGIVSGYSLAAYTMHDSIGLSLAASNMTRSLNTESKPLIIDSGASHHMISDTRLIKDIEPALGHVMIANGDRIPIKGVGNLRLFEKDSKAFYMPDFTSNLLSVKRVTSDLNCNVIFSPNDVKFQDIESSQLIGKGTTRGDLYMLEECKPLSDYDYALNSTSVLNNDALWHARLGHPHFRALNLIFPEFSFKNNDCEACILGKHCKTVFPHSSTIYENCFDLVHSDVWTAPCLSRENQKYYVTFIDEKSKYTWITLLKTKDRVLEAFKNFQSYITNHYNAKVKIFRSDNGGEYTSNAFKQYLAQQGIIHQTSCPYTPQQNGVAERKNRHLMEVARSMMFHTNVPKKFWNDAVISACYLINRIPTKVLQDVSPFEVLNKCKPSFDHLRVFGCLCYVLIPGALRNKLEEKSTRSMFIGYSTTQKGYKCYDPISRKVNVSRDVKFVESRGYYEDKQWDDLKDLSQSPSDRAANLRIILESLGIKMTQDQQPQQDHSENQEEENEPEAATQVDHEGGNETEPQDQDQTESSAIHDQVGAEEEEQAYQEENHEESDHTEPDQQPEQEGVVAQPLRRSTRIRYPPEHWKQTRVYFNANAEAHPVQATCSLAYYPDVHKAYITSLDEQEIPRSYEEAMKDKEWRASVADEAGAMIRNDTWFEAELPKGKKAVSSRWIFTIKYLADGTVDRKKTRLVARGFTQTYGEDYVETFAPVAKLHTIRIVLSVATNLEWELGQMDVKNAFLQGELEDEVYMHPPPGLEQLVKPGNVLRLKKAIYGLKQSPRAWYNKLSTTLNGRGFIKSELDHTLFTLSSSSGIIVLLVYVDDIIITGSDKAGIQATKDFLKSVFDIKDLGELKYFLGIEICRSKEGLFLNQRKYTLDLLKDAGMLDGKTARTPLEEDYKVLLEGETEDNRPFEDAKLYRKMVGKLIYLTITRPDICYAVNQVSQQMQAPKQTHWEMVQRILKFLNGTRDQGVWMGCNKSTEVVGYCDADWAGDRKDRRSTTGYCTFIGGNLVTWKSKKQKVVSCSSAEAEYRAMRKLTNELIWIKGLMKHLGIEITTPMTMHCDNQAAIHIASNSVFHERTKHIEVDCHKVRQMVVQGVILPCYTRSEDQLADVFTKAARQKTMESIHSRLGLIELSSRS